MAGATKLLTSSGGGVILTPASNIASDVTVQIPSINGTLATALGGVLTLNALTLGSSQTIPSGYSASSAGPITISSGYSVTISSGSKWVVL